MPKKLKKTDKKFIDRLRVGQHKRAGYYLAGLVGSQHWYDNFLSDCPEAGEINALAAMGLTAPKKDRFHWGEDQQAVFFYDEKREEHRWLADGALACAEELARIIRDYDIRQDGPLTPEELAGLARYSWTQHERFTTDDVLVDHAKMDNFPQSVRAAHLPKPALERLTSVLLTQLDEDLYDAVESESEAFFPHVFDLDEEDWARAGAVGSIYFRDYVCEDDVLFAVYNRSFDIAVIARHAAREIGKWLRKNAVANVPPGYRLSANETATLLLGARGKGSKYDGMPYCVLRDPFIPVKDQFMARLREKAIEAFMPVDETIAFAIKDYRERAAKRDKLRQRSPKM